VTNDAKQSQTGTTSNDDLSKSEGNNDDLHEEFRRIQHTRRLFWAHDYFIYINDNKMGWRTTKSFDKKTAPGNSHDHARFISILNQAALLQASVPAALPEHVKHMSYTLIGAALTSCFEFEYDNAEKMIQEAKTYVDTRNQETARYWYLSAALISSLPIIALGAVIWIISENSQEYAAKSWVQALQAFSAGTVGAVLSIASWSGHYRFDLAGGHRAYCLDALLRILSGALSGAIVYFAIKSKLILGSLVTEGNAGIISMFGALAGGFGERLVGSVVSIFGPATEKPPTGRSGT